RPCPRRRPPRSRERPRQGKPAHPRARRPPAPENCRPPPAGRSHRLRPPRGSPPPCAPGPPCHPRRGPTGCSTSAVSCRPRLVHPDLDHLVDGVKDITPATDRSIMATFAAACLPPALLEPTRGPAHVQHQTQTHPRRTVCSA